ncbi:MAG TPA: hypothetical protein VHG91_19400 [Longimicrobium sp.]|nr:hypothetical protein [Longimicrobium sp.]
MIRRLARAAAARFLVPRGSRREALWIGARLGVLTREGIHRLDERYYSGDGPQIDYAGDAHNTRGFLPWEGPVVQRFFAGCPRVLVLAAGGGREVLALRKMGIDADGYECHPGLAAFATGLLERHGVPGPVGVVGRDEAPRTGRRYDGVIVGWGAYMLIQGRARRVAFLRDLRALVGPGAPLLLSFFYRDGSRFRHALIGRAANALRRLRGREAIEDGDILAPNFIHLFTEDEVRAELRDGGFECVFYSTEGTGHAVGVAVDDRSTAAAG